MQNVYTYKDNFLHMSAYDCMLFCINEVCKMYSCYKTIFCICITVCTGKYVIINQLYISSGYSCYKS